MDFSNRSTQQAPTGHPGTQLGSANASGKLSKSARANSKWWRLGSIGLLFGIVILVVAILGLLYLGGPNEGKYIKTQQDQAVFLTNGQVYFGHIKSINSSFLELQNIYYLQSSSSSTSTTTSSTTPANTNVTLIKLGCELHAPYDQMIINVSQVSFWENIQSTGQVGKGIAQLKTCTQPTSSTSQSSNNAQTSTQNPATSNTSTTPATTTTTKP